MVTLDADIMRQLRATFKVEADEHIQAMNRILLALEKGVADDERINLMQEIFREAHSLKGAAGAADLGEVETTAHRLESILGAARNGDLELTPPLCDVLYEAIDAVSVIMDAALADQAHGLDLEDLYARLDAAKEGRVIERPRAVPAASVLPEPQPVVEAPAPAAAPAPQAVAPQPEPVVQVPVAPPAAAPQAPVAAAPTAAPAAKAPAPKAEAAPADDKSKKPAARSGAGANAVTAEETIRVATSKLDALMTQAGELMVAGLKINQRGSELEDISRSIEEWHRDWMKLRSSFSNLMHENSDVTHQDIRPLIKFVDLNQQRLKTLLAEVSDMRRGFVSDAMNLSRITSDVSESVMRVRMLPVSTLFDTYPRMIRDLCRDTGKEAELEVVGGDTELDRKVLEEIKDPLMHILRNSVDHGIEAPDVRARAGKNRQGKIVLSAFQKGNNIVIEVQDDGGGIDVAKVKKSALKSGAMRAEDHESMSDEEAMRLIFISGLSTSAMITDISGRGVGMDVLRNNIEGLHGLVEVDSVLGQGTTITLILPLTLATTQELLVQVSGQCFGIPISAVERIQRIPIQEISTVEGKEAIVVDGEPISLIHLASVLELEQTEQEMRADSKVPVVILVMGKKRIALLVDEVTGQQESVVKSLGKQLARVRNVAGATILGTGQVIMALNPADLINSARQVTGARAIARQTEKKLQDVQRRTVLVVDDSLTTRNLEKNILETAGYQVKLATDGMAALNLLKGQGCDVVVSDVLMPQMDGFELTAAMRQEPKLKDIPVILVTSLESRDDKERGIEVGANAYIVKSNFDQESLLQTIEQLI